VGLQTLAEEAGITERPIEPLLEKFLIELANLQLTREAFARLLKQFPAFFPPSLQHPYAVAFLRHETEKGNISITLKELFDVPEQRKPYFLLVYFSRLALRQIWDAATEPETAKWTIFLTRQVFANLADPQYKQNSVPPINRFELAMTFLGQHLRDTAKCHNEGCEITPYYFRKKKGQQYCSDTCATVAQREYKRRWWSENRAKTKKQSRRRKR
jgi:hypothetical protein